MTIHKDTDLDDTCNICHANEYETSIVEDEQGKLVCSDCYYERNETELLCFLSCANPNKVKC